MTEPGPSRRRALLAALLLAAGALAVYAPVLGHDFVHWDDQHYVTENRFVQRGLDGRSVAWAFRTSRTDNWHPLTWLSHMLDVELFGLDPGGHHATSALLHATNAALLFLVLAAATRAFWPSLLAAALFAFHPLRVESVAWVSERKDVLAAFFWIAAAGAHVRLARLRAAGRRGRGAQAAVLVLATLGFLAKPVLVTLPAALLLLDAWPLGRFRREPWGRLVLEKLPLVGLALAASWVTLRVQEAGGAVSSLEVLPLAARSANAVLSYGAYLGDTLLPRELVFFHPHPAVLDADFGWADGRVLASAAVLVALGGVAFLVRRRAPWVPAGLALFVLTALPTIGLVQVGLQGRADRYTYLPSIGLSLAVAWTVGALARGSASRARRAAVGAACGGVLVVLAVVTRLQIATWRSSEALFAHAVDVDPRNYLARNLLGSELLARGEVLAAREEFQAALDVRPQSLTGVQGMGFVELSLGRWSEAERWFRKVLRLRPSRHDARANLGLALERQGKTAEAEEQYARALEARPNFVPALVGLGRLALARGEAAEAVTWLERALAADPEDEGARSALAEARARLGEGD